MSYVLYHGTDEISQENIVNNGIDLNHNPRGGDFGVGFYLTPDLQCAKSMALRKAFASRKPGVVELTLRKGFASIVVVKDFGNVSMSSSDLEIMAWAQFIVNNRCGIEYINSISSIAGYSDNNLDKRYDIVIGATADGSVTKISRLCKSEKRIVTLNEAKEFLDKSFGVQYCINTQAGLSAIDRPPREKKGVSWR